MKKILLLAVFLGGCSRPIELPKINLSTSPNPSPTGVTLAPTSPEPTSSPATDLPPTISTDQVFNGLTITVPGTKREASIPNDTITIGDQFSQHLNADNSRDVFGSIQVRQNNQPVRTYLAIAKVLKDQIQHTSSIFLANNVEVRSISVDIVNATANQYQVIVSYAPIGSDPTVSKNAQSKTLTVTSHSFIGGETYNTPPVTSPNPNAVQ